MQFPTLRRKPFVLSLAVVVAALHVLIGPDYHGPARPFVSGYLMDLVLPFFLVLLLGADERLARLPHSPGVRALLTFLVGVVTEVAQAAGLPLFGRTFDPMDLLMYAIGAIAAMAVEGLLLTPPGPATADDAPARVAQNNSPWGEAGRGRWNRSVRSGGNAANPSRRLAFAKRRAMRSAKGPCPRMRVPNALS